MPFGLCNGPAVFQRTMDKIMSGLIGKSVMIYLDDVVIFSRSMEEHVKHVREVFKRLRNAGLKLKPSKCQFGLSEVKVLGYIVNSSGITSDPAKVEAISKLKPPTNVKGIRSFLGMTGYYRQVVKDYAKMAEPLL